jgi:tripartite-type tricarboxylate transporter receptor subunit TctC
MARINTRRRTIGLAAGAAAAWALFSNHARAGWPERPIRIVVPAGPGSVPDVRARWLADRLGPSLGQAILIENRPGAGGNLAMEAVARSAPDGYTLILIHQGLIAFNPFLYERVGYDPLRDFVCITRLGIGPLLLLVAPTSPFHTVEQLTSAARKASLAMHYGSQGVGTPPHLAAELFKQQARIDAVHVPYTTPTQPIADLIGGHLQWLFEGTPVALPLTKSGRVRALAVTGSQRLEGLPDVPTLAERGLPGAVFEAWTGLAAPAATPAAVIDRLYKDIAPLLHGDEAVAWFGGVGNRPGGETPEAAAAIARAEHGRWGPLIRSLGITLKP